MVGATIDREIQCQCENVNAIQSFSLFNFFIGNPITMFAGLFALLQIPDLQTHQSPSHYMT